MDNYGTQEAEFDLQAAFDEELGADDYGFILGPDGEVKAVFIPSDYFTVPGAVVDILARLGIEHPDTVSVHSLH